MKRKTAKKTNRKSLKDKYGALVGDQDSYMDEVNPMSDSEITENIFGNEADRMCKRGKYALDSASVSVSAPEYNGPIPLGFREIPPSHLVGFRGPIGKAFKHFGARNFYLGDSINAWFDQNCFVNKADSMPGEDAVAAGYTFKPKKGADKKLVSMLEDYVNTETFNLDETMRIFDHHKRCFGAAVMVPCFEEEVDMEKPFIDYGQLRGKTFIGWTVIEPYYLTPDFTSGGREMNDPTYKFYLEPTHWVVYGSNDRSAPAKRIHRSWTFFRRNIITSKIYQPAYKWQGPSIPQMIVERLYSAEVCANESSMLLRSKRTFIMEADIRKMIANPEWARKFLKNCSSNADNWGVRVVPRNSNAKQMDSYLSECMPLTTAQYGILCAEVDIPSPKFMMAQLTGFANSGNYEIKLYATKERNLQKMEFEPIVRQTMKIITACDARAVDFEVKFNDIDVPTITEQAEILYEKARAEKFVSEADAIRKGAKQPNSHKSQMEVEGQK